LSEVDRTRATDAGAESNSCVDASGDGAPFDLLSATLSRRDLSITLDLEFAHPIGLEVKVGPPHSVTYPRAVDDYRAVLYIADREIITHLGATPNGIAWWVEATIPRPYRGHVLEKLDASFRIHDRVWSITFRTADLPGLEDDVQLPWSVEVLGDSCPGTTAHPTGSLLTSVLVFND